MNKLSLVSNGHHREAHSQNLPTLALPDPQAEIEAHMRHILVQLGEDPEREGLQRTPHRVAKMYGELLEGYTQDLDSIVNGALFRRELRV